MHCSLFKISMIYLDKLHITPVTWLSTMHVWQTKHKHVLSKAQDLNWKYPWNYWTLDSDVSTVSNKTQKRFCFEEQLSNDEICPGIHFLLQMDKVFLVRTSCRMAGRIS